VRSSLLARTEAAIGARHAAALAAALAAHGGAARGDDGEADEADEAERLVASELRRLELTAEAMGMACGGRPPVDALGGPAALDAVQTELDEAVVVAWLDEGGGWARAWPPASRSVAV